AGVCTETGGLDGTNELGPIHSVGHDRKRLSQLLELALLLVAVNLTGRAIIGLKIGVSVDEFRSVLPHSHHGPHRVAGLDGHVGILRRPIDLLPGDLGGTLGRHTRQASKVLDLIASLRPEYAQPREYIII